MWTRGGKKRFSPRPPAAETQATAGNSNSERSRMIGRLKTLAGSMFTSPRGVHGIICEHGLACPDKGCFVTYESMFDDQLAEILRENEAHIDKSSLDGPEVSIERFLEARPEYAEVVARNRAIFGGKLGSGKLPAVAEVVLIPPAPAPAEEIPPSKDIEYYSDQEVPF